jgi:electron transfer flavoprotein alpha subunit
MLKINQVNITEEIKKELMEICPFGAFIEGNNGLEISAACKMCKLCVKKGPAGIVEYFEEVKETVNKDEWNGITVYVDHLDGEIHPVTYELIGKAKILAKVTNHPVYALFIGKNITDKAKELLYYGVDEVFVYDFKELEYFVIEPYTNAFEDFINRIKPSSILVGATNIGRSLAPRTAARFRTGLTADCTVLEMRENTDLVQIRPAFGGNIMAQIVTTNNRPQFCTVRYKVFDAPEKIAKASGKITKMELDKKKLVSNIKVLDITKKEIELDISEADVIIAAGRGVKTEKDMEMINELAELLGARTACTRPLIEAGWFDPRLQIGLSGRTVKPKLIITVGISGAVQFAAGMQNSDLIIAINNDSNAPIFNIAHYGIIGDLYEIIPSLLKRIKSGGSLVKAVV